MSGSYQKALSILNEYEKLYGKKIIKIIGAANNYILMNMGDGMSAGKPIPIDIEEKRIWSLPIMLAPEAGGPEEIGAVLVDDKTLEIVGATEKKQVLRNMRACKREKTALV